MTIKELQREITQLPPSELAELTEWFEEFLAQTWDKQIEQDSQSGRLDALIQQAEQEYEAGRYKPL
ncbi:MAG: hypothetical protein KIT87_22360 [Anaerolineae bacterium]|nr:hypothetical protein [Anaerolineae bacterium]